MAFLAQSIIAWRNSDDTLPEEALLQQMYVHRLFMDLSRHIEEADLVVKSMIRRSDSDRSHLLKAKLLKMRIASDYSYYCDARETLVSVLHELDDGKHRNIFEKWSKNSVDKHPAALKRKVLMAMKEMEFIISELSPEPVERTGSFAEADDEKESPEPSEDNGSFELVTEKDHSELLEEKGKAYMVGGLPSFFYLTKMSGKP